MVLRGALVVLLAVALGSLGVAGPAVAAIVGGAPAVHETRQGPEAVARPGSTAVPQHAAPAPAVVPDAPRADPPPATGIARPVAPVTGSHTHTTPPRDRAPPRAAGH